MSSKISYDEIIAMDEVCSFFSILSGISVPDVYDDHGHLKEEQD